MKRLILFIIFTCFFYPDVLSQDLPHLQCTKKLFSITEYGYQSQDDSVRRAKIWIKYNDGPRHVEYKYSKWYNAGPWWIPDFARLENKVNYFFDDNGNMLRESRYLWNSQDSSYTLLSVLNKDYNNDGRQVYEIKQEWNMIGSDLRGYYRNLNYDDNGNLIFENKCDWTESLNNWWGKYQQIHTHNEENQKTSTDWYIWNSGKREWEENIRNEWIYYPEGKLHKFIWYSWDPDKPGWDPGTMDEYSYDPGENSTLIVYYHRDDINQEWDVIEKMEQRFNSDDQIVEQVVQQWNSSTSSWEDFYREDIEYDVNGYRDLFESFHWNKSAGKWEGSQRIEYDFDAIGNRQLFISYRADETSEAWIAEIKRENTYDTSGNMTSSAVYNWDPINIRWTGTEKYGWKYDIDNDLVVTGEYEWDIDLEEWHLFSRSFYNYDSSSSINEIIYPDDISVYPNPTSGLINLEGINRPVDLEVLNMNGQVLKKYFQVEKIINVKDLEPGMYLLQIDNTIIRIITY